MDVKVISLRKLYYLESTKVTKISNEELLLIRKPYFKKHVENLLM